MDPANVSTLPGTAIILSRLPAQDWFTVEEAAECSGWSSSFIRARISKGELAAQKYDQKRDGKRGAGNYSSFRIHVDDLVLFIMRNSRGKYADAKLLSDAAMIIRTWPANLQRGLMIYLNRHLPSPPEAGSPVNGTGVNAQQSGLSRHSREATPDTAARSPGGERAAKLS